MPSRRPATGVSDGMFELRPSIDPRTDLSIGSGIEDLPERISAMRTHHRVCGLTVAVRASPRTYQTIGCVSPVTTLTKPCGRSGVGATSTQRQGEQVSVA